MNAPDSDRSLASVGSLIRRYFTRRLEQERGASPNTVTGYRDTFRLLLRFAEGRLRRSAAQLEIDDLGAPLVLAFLDHLERERRNSVRTRNVRLAAIRSFMHYVAREEPTAIQCAQRVLAIPFKRFDRKEVEHLSRREVQALLCGPDLATWSGRRDRTLLQLLYNTGARVSEILGLDLADLDLRGAGGVRLHGKGRKDRSVPLWKQTRIALRQWLGQQQVHRTAGPLFTNRLGARLTRSGVRARLQDARKRASLTCPSLAQRQISPHTLRHTTAMHLLEAGVDLSVIALWLGHESTTTTHQYLHADMALKDRALAKVTSPRVPGKRFQPGDRLLAFLDGL